MKFYSTVRYIRVDSAPYYR